MSLKEQIAADSQNVFLNTDEFADTHNINGQPMLAIIDSALSLQRSARQTENYDGIHQSKIILFVRESDLGYRPERDQKMTIDDKWYEVIECASDNDLLEITLGANET
jgi:hypothetical protein